MVEVAIREELWRELAALAQRLGRRPEILAEAALRDFLQRQADEELLASSNRAARRAPFRLEDTEEVIRRYRRRTPP